MRVSAQGIKDGVEKKIDYQAIEYEDKKKDLSAMMRTTAFPAIITLEMLVDGRIKDKGVLCQELSIPPGLFLEELEKRNIKFEINES
jgi:lysine 6-dehydrogenase